MTQSNPFEPRREVTFSDQTPSASIALGRKLSLYLGILATGSILGVALTRFPLILILGGFVGLVSTLIILLKPFLGLILYTIIFTLRLGEIYPILGHLHLERVVGALTIISLVLDQQRRTGTIHFDASAQTKRLLLFIGAVLLSVPMAFWRAEAVGGLVEFFKILVFYLMIVHLVDTRARMRHFVFLFCLTTIWICSNSLFSYLAGNAAFAQGIDRATGTTSAGGNANALGTTAASAIPLLVLLMMHKGTKRMKRSIFGIGAVILLVTLVVTGSRASLLGFVGGLVYFWWRSRHRLPLAVIGVLLLILGFHVMPEQYQQRYSTITSSHIDQSSESRLITWHTGLRLFMGRPIFGVGIDCFGDANGALTGSYLSSHSLYLQVLAELGLIGAVTFILLFSEMVRLNRRTIHRFAGDDSASLERTVLDGIFAGFVVLFISGIFGHSLLRRTWYIFAAMNLAYFRIWFQSQSATDSHLSSSTES